MGAAFYAERPPQPARDWRYYTLLLPSLAATAGAVAYAVQGYAVSNGGVLPAAWVDSFCRWGGVLLALGCEGGSLSAAVEVWRKKAAGRAVVLDYVGLAVSFAATVTARALALAELRATWALVVLIVASAADAYVGFMELGFYLAEYTERITRWLAAEAQWAVGDTLGAQHILEGADVARVLAGWPQRQAQLAAYARADAQVRADVPQNARGDAQVRADVPQNARGDAQVRADVPQAPRTVARVADWRRISAGLNGARAHLTADEVAAMLTAAGYALPQARTLQGWAQAARGEVGR